MKIEEFIFREYDGTKISTLSFLKVSKNRQIGLREKFWTQVHKCLKPKIMAVQ